MGDVDSFASDADLPIGDIKRIQRNVLNPELEREVEEAFELFDRDGNGLLDFFECQASFRALRLNASRDTIRTMFAEINKEEDSYLSMKDFKTLVLQVIHKRYNSSEAAKIFALLEDGTGKITVNSLHNVLKRLGTRMDDEDVQLMITEAAPGKDHVSFEEFKKILKQSWRGDPLTSLYDSE